MSISSTTKAANTMRITGMATGMDTDAMVKAMTSNIQYKIDKANQEKQIAQWKQEMYRDIIKDVKGLQDYFDQTSSKYILGDGKFNPTKVTNSNESAVGFTASSTAQNGNYKIDVTTLAQPALLQGLPKTGVSSNTKLSDVGITGGSLKFKFKIDGEAATTDVNIADVSGKTVQDIVNAINNDSNIKAKGVTATFDDLSHKFVFSNKSGDTSKLALDIYSTGLTGSIGNLGLVNSYSEVQGQNAAFKLTYPDGRTEPISQTSNQFTANGITYNLKSTGVSNVTVTKNNADAIIDNLKKFKDDYNNLVDKIQGKLTEKKQFSVKPLTDEQKKDMKDEDIKNWETKAKQGLLKNDDNLENILSDLKSAFSDTVFTDFAAGTGVYNQADANKNPLRIGSLASNSIGIDTSSDIADLGKIQIKDEAKLRDTITNHIEDFTKMFIGKSKEPLKKDPLTNLDEPYKGSEKYYEDGIFTRMDSIIRNYAGDPGIGKDGTSTVKGILNIYANKQYDFSITGISSKNTLPDQIYGKVRSVNEFTDKLNDAQNRYYKKFAALEKAMNNMNSQMSKFQSQMG